MQSDTVGECREWDLEPEPRPGGGWGDYVLASRSCFGAKVTPTAAPRFWSRATCRSARGWARQPLEVAVAMALVDVAGRRLDPTTTAMLCQRVENEFVGARSGSWINSSRVTPAGTALLLDCRSSARAPPVPSGVRLVACNTTIRHVMRAAASAARGVRARGRHPADAAAVASLRDVDPITLEAHRAELPDEIFRRCRHVVTENHRVLRIAALEQGDLAAIGPLMAESHRSLRDDYEVSCPELDAMVEAAAMPGVHGARMTGGGFGGCTVNLVDREAVDEFMRQVPREASTGRRGSRERCRRRRGAGEIAMPDPHDGPHRRFNPLLGEWVLVSPQRLARPWLGRIAAPSGLDRHLRPGMLSLSGNARAGARNPSYEGTFVFDNDFPALSIERIKSSKPIDTLLLAVPEYGVCRVVCYSPRHDAALPSLSIPELRRVVDVWVEQLRDPGREAGHDLRADLREPRRRDGATRTRTARSGPVRPARHARARAGLVQAARAAFELPLCEYLAREQAGSDRVVVSNDFFTALARSGRSGRSRRWWCRTDTLPRSMNWQTARGRRLPIS